MDGKQKPSASTYQIEKGLFNTPLVLRLFLLMWKLSIPLSLDHWVREVLYWKTLTFTHRLCQQNYGDLETFSVFSRHYHFAP